MVNPILLVPPTKVGHCIDVCMFLNVLAIAGLTHVYNVQKQKCQIVASL